MTYYTGAGFNGRTIGELANTVVASMNASPEICIYNLGEPAVYAVVTVGVGYFVYSRTCQNGSTANFQINTTEVGGAYPGSAGTASSISGTVTVSSGENTFTTIAGFDFLDGDTITTALNSTALITLADGSTVEAQQNSILQVINDARIILQDGIAQLTTGFAQDASFLAETVTGTISVQLRDGSTVEVQNNSILSVAKEIYFGADSPFNSAVLVVQEGIAQFAADMAAAGSFIIETRANTGQIQLPAGQVSLLPNSVLELLAAGFAPGTPADKARMIVQEGVAQFTKGAGQVGSFVIETLASTGQVQLPAGQVSLLPNSALEVLEAGFAPGSPASDAAMILQDGVAQFTAGVQQTGSYVVKIRDDITATLQSGARLEVAKNLYYGPGSPANDAVMILKDGFAQFVTGLKQTGSFIVETASGLVGVRR